MTIKNAAACFVSDAAAINNGIRVVLFDQPVDEVYYRCEVDRVDGYLGKCAYCRYHNRLLFALTLLICGRLPAGRVRLDQPQEKGDPPGDERGKRNKP